MAFLADHSGMSASWDPTKDPPTEPLSGTAIRRIKVDLESLQTQPCWGILAVPDESNIAKVNLLVVGPEGTPYYGGFFHFLVVFSSNYPSQPPKVKILNTDGDVVRYNPNLYANGKVCLSILGTWPGPSWTPTMNLMTVAVSIQSLMGEEPLFNEPGINKFNTEANFPSLSNGYNAQIRHEVTRVAVIQFLKKYTLSSHVPSLFRTFAIQMFPEFYQAYLDSCDTYETIYQRTTSTSQVDRNVPQSLFRSFVLNFPLLKQELMEIAEELAPESINHELTNECNSDRSNSPVVDPLLERDSYTPTTEYSILASPDDD